MEANRKTIADFFNGSRILQVPFFQRSYVWEEDQWERFLQDMEFASNGNQVFLGPIILKQLQGNADRNIGDIRIIIDGQQRLTTIHLFFKALFLKLHDNDQYDRIFKTYNRMISLELSHIDCTAFSSIVDSTNTLDVNNIEHSSSLVRAFKFFIDNIVVNRIEYGNILNHTIFVGIDLHHDEDEQQIFDTINSLGVKLTTAELLKNFFFNRDVNQYEIRWKPVFEPDEDTKEFWDKEITSGRQRRSNSDVLFHSFLQIKIHETGHQINAEDRRAFSCVEKLFNSYKRYIENYGIVKPELLDEINEYAQEYMNNVDWGIVNRELTYDNAIERINIIIFGLEHTTIIPYLLYLMMNATLDEVNPILHYMESYLMRRLICKVSAQNYNQLFTDSLIGNNVLSYNQLADFISNLSGTINYMPSDEEVMRGFSESKLTNKQAK